MPKELDCGNIDGTICLGLWGCISAGDICCLHCDERKDCNDVCPIVLEYLVENKKR